MTLGAFGATAGIFAIFFFGEVPRVRNDLLSKLPFIGHRFVREIPASDNVCVTSLGVDGAQEQGWSGRRTGLG